MSEQKKNGKKIALIVTAAVVLVALIVTAVVLIVKNSDRGPEDENGNPLYPKASQVTSVEYLHRDGLNESVGLVLNEKEITDKEDIEAFLDELKEYELTEPTEKDRAAVDYSSDVDMFTLKLKEGGDDTLLVMGDTISISNENGNFFYVIKDLDVESLTEDFGEIDYSSRLVSADDAEKD